MDEVGIYVTIIAALLGVAYPILLQVIARLDEKYDSENIVGLFNSERIKQEFQFLLVTSLISIFLWSLKFFNTTIHFEDCACLKNLAYIFILLSSIGLVTVFFLFVDKMLLYYTPTKLVKYLIQKHNDGSDFKFFYALSDIFFSSIKRQNIRVLQTLSSFYSDIFKKEREKSKSKAVEYPDDFYNLVYETIKELQKLKDARIYFLENRTVGSLWLLGGETGYEISDKTYMWLWRNILLAVNHEQDEMVMYHWSTAHQYMTYSLMGIYPEYERGTAKVLNKDEIDKRNKERKKFKEFHYALGGLLLYKRRYACIYRIFNYTMSEPPHYDLLPESMDEIFKIYVEFQDPYGLRFDWISSKYPFPDMDGISSDRQIKKWIANYMAVLLLRQYTLHPYLINQEPLGYPTPPHDQGEKQEWINSLDFFKQSVSDFLNNQELIEKLELKFLTPEWCGTNTKEYPVTFIENVKKRLLSSFNNDAVNLPVSQERVDRFLTTTPSIIEESLDSYASLNNKLILSSDTNTWFVKEQQMILNKDALSLKPMADHMNYHTILAEIVIEYFQNLIFFTFSANKKQGYLLKSINLFKAIGKLRINEDYILIMFGINVQHYIDIIKVNGLTSDNYNGLKILNFRYMDRSGPCIFVIKKSDLPNIMTIKPEQEIIDTYSLTKQSTKYDIWASVLELNKQSPEFRAKNSQGNSDDELLKSALLSVFPSIEITWKNKVTVIQLVEYSEYRQRGLPNNLSEIQPLNS